MTEANAGSRTAYADGRLCGYSVCGTMGATRVNRAWGLTLRPWCLTGVRREDLGSVVDEGCQEHGTTWWCE